MKRNPNKKRVVQTEIVCPALLRTTKCYSSEPIDNFLIRSVKVKGKDAHVFTSDIYLLFTQNKLSNNVLGSLNEHFAHAGGTSDALASLRSKISDSDLNKFIKSRYIQSKSELMSWSGYLMNEYDVSQNELQAYIQSLQSQAPSIDTPANPAPTPD